MTKIKLLATSIVAFGMFYSAEGMNELPKLNLATGNTNSVNQFAAVTQFTSNSNAVNLQKQETGANCNVCKENIHLSEVIKIRKENQYKNIEFKNVTCDKDGFWNLLQTTGNELVDKGIITLANNNAGYIKGNIKSIDLEKFETTYSVKITKIGDECFFICGSLEKITIPEGVTELKDKCFWGCESLTSITLPSSVKCIGFSCFFGCKSLQEITFSGDNVKIPSDLLPRGVFVKYVKEVDNDLIISNNSFNFMVCVLPKITANRCRDLCGWQSKDAINIDEAIKDNKLFFWNALIEGDMHLLDRFSVNFLNYINIKVPDGITRLENRCFKKYPILQSITLPSSLKEIGFGCFEDCCYLTTLVIPTTVTKIGHGIFSQTLAGRSLNDIFNQLANKEYEDYEYRVGDGTVMYTFEQYKETINVDLWNIIYDRITCTPLDIYRRKAEDVFKCLQNLNLKSFGWLDFAEPQDMAEFSEKYPKLTSHILIDSYKYDGKDLISLEIPTTVTSLNSRISYLKNVSSLTFPSTIKTVYVDKQIERHRILGSCSKLKELHIPLNMPGLSSEYSFCRCPKLTAIYDVDNPNSDPATFVSSKNPSQQVAQAVLKLKELKLSEQK